MKDRITINEIYYLSQVNENDIDDLINTIGEYEVSKNLLMVPHPYTVEDAVYWVNHVEEERLKYGRILNWTIRNKDGEMIGGIGQQLKYGKEAHRDEIGYWLAKPYWGKGLMTEIVKVFCDYLIENYKYVRLEAPVYARNKGSARVLEKNGFENEGLLRKAYFKEGEYLDGYMYALVL